MSGEKTEYNYNWNRISAYQMPGEQFAKVNVEINNIVLEIKMLLYTYKIT